MIDANARSPLEPSSSFGLAGATTESKTTRDFELSAVASRLWAPSTFGGYVDVQKLQGTFHFDELAPLTRIDFVMLGGGVQALPRTAGVEEIALHAKKADHLPTAIQVAFLSRSIKGPMRRRKAPYCRDAVCDTAANENFGHLLDACEFELLDIEPSSHMHLLTQKVASAAADAFASTRATPRRPCMSPTTFTIVKEMKHVS